MIRRARAGFPKPAGTRVARARAATSFGLSGGGAAREFAARVRRAALVVGSPCTKQGYCTGESPLSLGARPWYDVPAAAYQNLLAFAWHGARGRTTAFAVSRTEAHHASLLSARAVPRWLWCLRAQAKGNVPARDLFPSACGRGATCQMRLPKISRHSRDTRGRAATSLGLSGGGTAREFAACVRRAALVVVGPCTR